MLPSSAKSLGLLLVLSQAAPLPAQQVAGDSGLLRVHLALAPIPFDGRLATPDWTIADSITDFRQREPLVGTPASRRTVVKVLRDADALYVGVRAYDDQPSLIRARQLRRDAELSSDDHVQLLIDSFHDRRGAFVFGTNPNGVHWDAQLTDLDNLNTDWNGIWDVAVTRDSAGWTAEFRIPFRTLRFYPGDNVRFGFNVRRFIRRANEEDLWRSWGRAQGLYQLIEAGELTDIGLVQRSRGVELSPYVLGRAIEPQHDSLGTRVAGGFVGGKAGVDAKLAVTPTLTTDLTLGTDFAQVEVDQQVINLTRFPFFFPEKRNFFLESSGQFDFGTPGHTQVFYSRRIGLDTSGSPVPIIAGGRVYGRIGSWRLGGLDARTGGTDDANNAVIRVQRDLFARSYLGVIGSARTVGGGGTQTAGGFDIDLPLVLDGQNIEPKFWIAGTHTPGIAGFPLGWRASVDYPNDLFDNFVSLYRIDANFDPALGFVRRTGIWETTGHFDYMPRPHAPGIRQLDFTLPLPSWDVIANASGSLGRPEEWQTAWFEFRVLGGDRDNGDHFEINLQRQMDAPQDTFPIFHDVVIPPGTYWWSRYELQYFMSSNRPLSLGAFVNWGGFYDGRSTDVELEATWRGGGHVILNTGLARTTANLPAGGFTANQASGRIEYNFDTRTTFQGFVQYTNEDQRVDFNLRFHWIPKVGDDVFLVWNSGYTTNAAARFRFPSSRSLTQQLNGAFALKIVHRLAS
ncbi:MAG TPA: DUF5916 domain-containing protein [Gemmatimonadales bacterium]|nr:DUF5916 domain-containing protein [Gemmatimonadales bacterium]